MTLEAQVLQPNAVRSTTDGYEVDLHLAWYRSLPLSCLEGVDLSIDGTSFDQAQLRVRVEGRDETLDALAEMDDTWWFVQDALTVVVPQRQPQPAGSTVAVEVTLSTRVPYIIIGPETALVQRTRVQKQVVVQ